MATSGQAGDRWGLTVPVGGRTLAEHGPLAQRLADLGYTDLWSVEANGFDGTTPLAVAAMTEPRLRVGTAILSVFTRGPGLLAQTAAAMADLAPGRFALGLGASSDVIVERWNGIRFDRPYARTRDVVRFVRRALAGERVDGEFETFSARGFRLAQAPAQPPPVLVAALRPRMLRMAGAEADGVILNWLSAADVGRVVPLVHEGNDKAEVVCRVMVCATDDWAAVRRTVAPIVTAYLTVPVYRAYHEWLGRGPLLAPMWEAWDRGDRAAALELVPDEVVDALCAHGSPAACRARIARYVEHGVTTPVLAPLPVGGAPEELHAALAPQG